jgi:hypothetical protein
MPGKYTLLALTLAGYVKKTRLYEITPQPGKCEISLQNMESNFGI